MKLQGAGVESFVKRPDAKVKAAINGKSVVKAIVVPKKLVSLVIK